MAKAEWGVKRACPNCGNRYYDMKKNPPTCPKCATTFDPEVLLKSRRRAVPEVQVKKPEPEVVAEDALEVDDVAEGEAEEAVIEDAAELGDEETELEEAVVIEEPAEGQR